MRQGYESSPFQNNGHGLKDELFGDGSVDSDDSSPTRSKSPSLAYFGDKKRNPKRKRRSKSDEKELIKSENGDRTRKESKKSVNNEAKLALVSFGGKSDSDENVC